MNSAVSAAELFARRALSGGSGTKLNMFFKPTSKRGQKDQNGGGFSKERFLSPSLISSEDEERKILQRSLILTSRERKPGSGLLDDGRKNHQDPWKSHKRTDKQKIHSKGSKLVDSHGR